MTTYLYACYEIINKRLYILQHNNAYLSFLEFKDIKGVIRIRKSKKNRQHNGQKKKNKQRLTKHTHKTKDRVTRIPLKTEGDSGAPEEWTVSATLMTIIHVHAYYKTMIYVYT
jgi:hypothetical protein